VIGRQISHFYIIRTLGTGGMGEVYEAQDTRLPRSVAIKVLKEELSKNVDAVRRFKREARLASSLNHPNICTILEVSEDESQSFIAMELLEGASLKSRLLGGPLSLGEIVDITRQVADALGAAHDQGIIHRDITPANIFLTVGGLVKLLDFGLAKHFPTSDGDIQTTDDLTSFGAVAGTIHYMSPEQLAGAASVDYRCDFFALGAVLYQMATGARPFDILPRTALSAAIQIQPHMPMRQLAPHHPVQLERIIDTLLAKHPDGRYQSAGTLRAELDALQRGMNAVTPGAESRAASASVAVLPFDVLGAADPDTLSLRDGLAADLSSRLSRVEDLWVAPRTSTRALTGQSVREIGKRLGVEMVLEGTLQRTTERIRVTANLIDAAHERALLPSLVIDRAFDDPLTTQDDIARGVCDGIAAVLSRAPARRHSQEPDAYHAFKRGQHSWKSCFEGGWRAAIEHFQHAIDRDPQFALAHVALASAYNFLGFYSLVKPNLAFAVARRAAERALAIDPTLGSAFIEVALAKFGGDWDWDGSEQAFRQGLALDSTNPLAHVHYSWLLMLMGREGAAFAEAQRGHALAPSSRFVAAARAQTLYLGGQYYQAIELCSECLRFDPAYVFALHMRGLCYLAKSMRDGAIADLERAASLGHRAPFYLGLLGRCYAEFSMRGDALKVVAELSNSAPDTYVPPQCYVYIYAALGERERALEYQEKAYADGASPFNYLFPSIRALYALSPHHKKRLEQMRLIL
jgi:TolB-like protein/tetratricopeptide (TPR) repeat protein/tRNA A-37 threonylcarbamoyl transferase component Bud32